MDALAEWLILFDFNPTGPESHRFDSQLRLIIIMIIIIIINGIYIARYLAQTNQSVCSTHSYTAMQPITINSSNKSKS